MSFAACIDLRKKSKEVSPRKTATEFREELSNTCLGIGGGSVFHWQIPLLILIIAFVYLNYYLTCTMYFS